MDLNVIWFFLMGVLLVAYAILDGFDLGVGILYLFADKEKDRPVLLKAIGPFWDGNEVWLLTFGGAMFAAFPEAYATIFSGFYIAFMLLLAALIFRAVSIEFRNKVESPGWRNLWDYAFFGGSLTATLLFGVAVGNAMMGLPIEPLNGATEYTGGFLGLLRPFPVVAGLLTIMTFSAHGAAYVALRTTGSLREQFLGIAKKAALTQAGLFVLTTLLAFLMVDGLLDNYKAHPVLFIIPLLAFAALGVMISGAIKNQPLTTFGGTALGLAMMAALFGVRLWPNMVISNISPDYNLTIYNAASTAKTHGIMFVIVLLGVPVVIAYTIYIYWLFRGKIQAEDAGY